MIRHVAPTTIALFLAATPALADLAAKDVWAAWQRFAERNGYTFEAASETQSGATLTIAGVTFSTEVEDGSVSGELGELKFVELGDGSVSVDLPADYPIRVTGTGEDGEAFSTTITVSHNDLEVIASGTPEAISYAYDAPRLSIGADAIEADGGSFPFEFDMTATAMNGTYMVTEGEPMQTSSTLTAGGLAVVAAASDPEGAEGSFSMNATLSDLQTSSEGTMTSLSAMAGLGELIAGGLETEGTASYGNGNYEIKGDDGEQQFDIRASVGSGNLTFGVGEAGISYGGSNDDVTLSLQSSELPIPDTSFAIDASSWQFDIPIAVSQDPQDIKLALTLDGLTISDMLWSMFDPGQALPRDPATLILALSGKGNWLVDVTSPDFDEEALTEMPGQIHELTIDELNLNMVGAELTGTGDFTFDNSAGPELPPTPIGQVDLRLVGGNGLIDNLIAMGMLPEDQAMGARMMLGLFARPGDGEDTLVSTIELTEGGGIVANGQPLR